MVNGPSEVGMTSRGQAGGIVSCVTAGFVDATLGVAPVALASMSTGPVTFAGTWGEASFFEQAWVNRSTNTKVGTQGLAIGAI